MGGTGWILPRHFLNCCFRNKPFALPQLFLTEKLFASTLMENQISEMLSIACSRKPKKDSSYRVSQVVEEGAALFEALKQTGLEGIVAKERHSAYLPGKRSECWLKIKTRQTLECAIIGYTRGKGDRETNFGALHLAQSNAGELKYVGKVGAGLDDHLLKTISAELKQLATVKRPVKEKPLDDARSIWVEPKLMCEVEFASLTKDGMLREPVFIRLRPDLILQPRMAQ